MEKKIKHNFCFEFPETFIHIKLRWIQFLHFNYFFSLTFKIRFCWSQKRNFFSLNLANLIQHWNWINWFLLALKYKFSIRSSWKMIFLKWIFNCLVSIKYENSLMNFSKCMLFNLLNFLWISVLYEKCF